MRHSVSSILVLTLFSQVEVRGFEPHLAHLFLKEKTSNLTLQMQNCRWRIKNEIIKPQTSTAKMPLFFKFSYPRMMP
jgi:hypothetical protein